MRKSGNRVDSTCIRYLINRAKPDEVKNSGEVWSIAGIDINFEKYTIFRRFSIEKSFSWCYNIIEKSAKR